MLALFRTNTNDSQNESQQGYQLISSILDLGSNEFQSLTRINSELRKLFHSLKERTAEYNIDPTTAKQYFDQIEQSGISVKQSSPTFSDQENLITWDDLEIKTSQQSFLLKFEIPDGTGKVEIQADHIPDNWFYVQNDVSNTIEGMSYLTNPNVLFKGLFGKESMTGKLWIDHQWGTLNWFLTKDRSKQIKGWKWFGIHLDNGVSFLLWQSINPVTKEIYSTHIDFLGYQDPNRFHSIQIVEEQYWFSHNSYCYFPTKHTIRIADYNCELIFSSDCEDQEHTVFGLMRSVWQGSGRIEGTFNGKKVGGIGRCEIAGHAYINNFDDFLKPLIARIDTILQQFFPKILGEKHIDRFIGKAHWTHEPDVFQYMLANPSWDLIVRSGKRWRPLFAYFLLRAFGVSAEPYEELIYASGELIHTGSLIIDDIQDNSLLRRGGPCLHLKYGQDIAINAANTLYYLPTVLIEESEILNQRQKLSILYLFNKYILAAHFGQSYDIYYSKYYRNKKMLSEDRKLWEKRILQTYSLKTAAPIEALVKSVCVISEVDPNTMRAATAMGSSLGIAYQILDDVKNFNASKEWGKEIGEDLKQGKMTFLIAHALSHLPDKQISKIERILMGDCTTREVDEGIKIIQNSNSINACIDYANSIGWSSWKRFEKLLKPSEAKIVLQAFVEYLLRSGL